jgi:IclR family transcriptional regulator, KDG regulon repressor
MDRETGIQSVNRALRLLCQFTHGAPRLGITDFSNALGLSKPTVHGLVRTLVKQGFLQQDPETRKYGLGLKIYELGIVLAGSLEINQKGAGPAYQLAKRTGLVSRIAIWDADSALLTVNMEPRSHLFFVYQIGPRIPAYCSAVGKALLASLEARELGTYLDRVTLDPYTANSITQKDALLREIEETRRRGYSVDREENVSGLACIGTPIFGHGGHLEGAISISGDAKDIYARMETLVHEVVQTAREISRSLGYFPESLGVRVGGYVPAAPNASLEPHQNISTYGDTL